MKILIDADACPVKGIIIDIARNYDVPLVLISSINHNIDVPYGEVVTVDHAKDEADHRIVAMSKPGDLVVTQDYGLAAILLGKKVHVMHHDGWFYNTGNIDALLMRRHLAQQKRNAEKRHTHHPKRRPQDDILFKEKFIGFLREKGKLDQD